MKRFAFGRVGEEVPFGEVSPEQRIFALRKVYSQTPRWTLPLWVNWKWKWPAGFAICAFALVFYAGVNRHVLARAVPVPLLGWDRLIPLWPGTVWVYLSGLVFLPIVYAVNRCRVSLNRHLWSFLAAILIAGLCFEAFPTRFPRERFPLPLDCVDLNCQILAGLRAVDPPANAAPSLHVTLSILIALGFREDRLYHPWPFIVAMAWAIALSVSTLTTKQHSVLDVATGCALALLLHFVFHRWLPVKVSREEKSGSEEKRGEVPRLH